MNLQKGLDFVYLGIEITPSVPTLMRQFSWS